MRRTLYGPNSVTGGPTLISNDDRTKKIYITVKDAGRTVFLGHSHMQLACPSPTGVGQEGTPFTSLNTPARVDWDGPLWACADQDGVNTDIEVSYR